MRRWARPANLTPTNLMPTNLMPTNLMPTNFTVKLIERLTDPIQRLLPARSEPVDPRRFGPLGFSGSKPAACGHPRQHRIQRARTQAIAVVLQLLEHPLAVDTLLVSMMKDMNLPERKEELTDDRIAHRLPIIAPPSS